MLTALPLVVKSRLSYAIKLPIRKAIWYALSSHKATAQYPTTAEPQAKIYLHQGRDPNIVNVFDQNGVKQWTIECMGRFSNDWQVFTAHNRTAVAKITLGYLERKVDFYHSQDIPRVQFHRDLHCGGMFNCAFTLKDGSSFYWGNQSRYLEKIVHLSDGGETRIRVARAKLLRKWSFDWEISLDSSFDPIIVLATAFMPMQSQWDLAEAYPPSMRSIVSPIRPACDGKDDVEDNDSLFPGVSDFEKHAKFLIYQPDQTDLSFFNPPSNL